jgi:hypothetical protein
MYVNRIITAITAIYKEILRVNLFGWVSILRIILHVCNLKISQI